MNNPISPCFHCLRTTRFIKLSLILLAIPLNASSIRLEIPREISGLAFGEAELRDALAYRGHELRAEAGRAIKISLDPSLPSQGFNIETGSTISLQAGDAAGIMYGLLELAEQVRLFDLDGIQDTSQAPSQPDRGIKYNIPLDVRSPTYTEPSDTAQLAMPESWSFQFWKELIDSLARKRYNMISLWSLHPFPSMVRVPEFPEVALDDVRRSTVKWEEHYALQATGLDAPEIINNFETIKVMTIEEKIEFWRSVMAYAKERHVKFYIVTWNIFVNGTEGRYGIDDSIDNPVTREYFRASVRTLLETYPDLAGVGLTTGENMPDASFQEKEDWAFATYGLGLLDAARAHPDRQFTFIHRQHQAKADEIAKTFAPLIDQPNVNFIFSFKYAQAHAMSSVRQPFANGFVEDIPPIKTLWTLRNDSNYLLRWGGARFVREFIQNIPSEVSAGMYYGSDQWVWAREFLSKNPLNPRELELSKHWYHWMLWGRLSYNPQLTDERIIAILGDHFPGVDAKQLFTAWNDASMIYPLTTGFHWGVLDFRWYPEACQSRPGPANTPSGFHDINRFISLRPHPGTDSLSIPDFVEASLSGAPTTGTSPLQVADALLDHARRALESAENLGANGSRELWLTIEDIRAMAYLGRYYGHKIKAATALAMLRATWNPVHQEELRDALNAAAHDWRQYLSRTGALYKFPLWTNRVGIVDLRKSFQSVLYDLTICGIEPDIPSMQPTKGGVILEAEETQSEIPVESSVTGYTGEGYLNLGKGDRETVDWSFVAPDDGTYVLEIRYNERSGEIEIPAGLEVNGEPHPDFQFTSTGDVRTWAWDRAVVSLRKGPNIIRLRPEGRPLIDHLNILQTGF